MASASNASMRRLPRRVLVAVGVVTLVALGVRLWHWNNLEIAAFDEGVYAGSAKGISALQRPFPGVQFQSPPAYYVTGAVVSALTGLPAHRSLLLISLLAGVGTVFLAGIAGSIWFGAEAGTFAAAILAVSDLHIRMSRCAMTDATFSFCFLLALFAGSNALSSGTRRDTLLAGCAVGLAWATKFHGWFAVVVLALAVLADLIRARNLHTFLRRIRTIAAVSVIAGLMFLPAVVLILLSEGLSAYLGIVRSSVTRDYIGAIGQYWQIMAGWDGAARTALIPLAVVAALAVSGRRYVNAGVATLTGILTAATVPFGLSRTLFLAAPLAIRVLWRSAGLGGPIVLSSLLLWMISAPRYNPAYRLLLPLLVTAALAVGALLAGFWRERDNSRWLPSAAVSVAVLLLIITAGSGLISLQNAAVRSSPWQITDYAAAAARRIRADVPRDAVLLMSDTPSCAYYLSLDAFPVTWVKRRITEVPTTQVYLAASRPMLDVTTHHGSLIALLQPYATRLWTEGEGKEAVTLYRVDPPTHGSRP